MNEAPGLAGAVLAGGQSRRMGRDKAMIELEGQPLVARAAAALREAGADPVVVVGGDGDAIHALGLDHRPDIWPAEGPLGGIITALRVVGSTHPVAVLSCDLTDASPIAVRSVAGALGDADVAVPVVDGIEQWLHAVWRPRALDALEAAFATGVRAPRHAVEALRVVRLLDGDPCWFHDADAPGDLPPTAG